jgi:TP901 family phage tail tape measure protein
MLTVSTKFTAIDAFSGKLRVMGDSVSNFAARSEREFRKAGQSAFAVGKSAGMIGVAIAAPLALAVKSAIDFEDKMSDVAKTTGLKGAELTKFGDDILSMSKTTRTSIDDLIKIGEIGGQLGIAGKDLVSFTSAADKFNIALGADFSGGVEDAVSTVGKIKSLFSETRGLNISDSIMKTGSAINELGAVGAGTSANIADFTLRMGALPDALKSSISNTMSLGTFFEEMGIDSQIASGGMTNFLLVAGKNIGKFAGQMKMTSSGAKDLLKNDPTEFSKKFATTFKGVAPDVLAKKLNALGIGSQETIKVIGALGSATQRLTELQDVSSTAFTNGTSLQNEAAKKNATMAAKMAILRNNVKSLSITIGNALLPVINGLVKSVTPFIQKIANWIGNNKELATTIFKVVAGFAAFALAVSGVAFAVGIFQKAMVIGKIAMAAFNLVAMANPLGILLITLAAVAFGVYQVAKAFNTSSIAEQVNAEVKQRAFDKTVDQRVEIIQLFEALKKAKVGTEAYTTVLSKIDAMQPGITKKYMDQNGVISDQIGLQKELTNNIMKRAETEVRAEMLKESIKKGLQLKQELAQGPGVMDYLMYGNFADTFKKKEIIENNQKTAVLEKQVTSDQTPALNPMKAKSDAQTNAMSMIQRLHVNITGLPAGVSAEAQVKGKTNGMNVPKLTSTSK